MRILILQDDFPPYHVGGAGVIAYNLAKEFKRLGHDVLVVTAVQDRRLAGSGVFEDILVERLFSKYHERWQAYFSLYNPQVASALKKIIREFKPQIVHAHNVHGHLSYHSLKLAALSSARVFLTAHDAMLYQYGKAPDNRKVSQFELIRKYRLRYNPLRQVCIRRYLKYVFRVIAVSDALKEALINNGITCTKTIHNGIDPAQWVEGSESIANFKEEYRLGDKVILFSGRLSAAKGGEKIFEAFRKIIATIPDAQLLVIGKRNSYAERMLVRARREGVSDKIVFTGWIQGHQLREAYHAASVVAVPSVYLDPFPTVNLEAMACGKSIVATSLGGSKELVLNDETGYIIDPFDVPTMTEKLSELLRNTEKNRTFGEAGHERVLKEFTLAQQAARYEVLFLEK